jgi:molybdate transport system substrate-binding protein
MGALQEPGLKTLAIANPEHAPYGRAARAALTSLGLMEMLMPKLVTAENIAQAAQFVESGNAQLGLISLTLGSSERLRQEGSFIRIPAVTYTPINQTAVVMKKSAHRADAHAFLDWLRSPPIQRNLPQYGLETIDYLP